MQSILTFSQLGQQGRLGNQLFQIMAVIGTARRLGLRIQLPFMAPEYREYFFKDMDCMFSNNIPEPTHFFKEQHFHYTEIKLEDFIAGPNYREGDVKVYDMSGYYQTSKYWEFSDEDFKRYFKFFLSENEWMLYKHQGIDRNNVTCFYKVVSSELESMSIFSLRYSFEEIKQNNTIVTGIHIRGTDYINPDGIFVNLNEDYYVKFIERVILKQYAEEKSILLSSKTKFAIVIFSDDYNNYGKELTLKIKQRLSNYNFAWYYSFKNSDVRDLYFMSMCDHLITANSSFSWWAAAFLFVRSRLNDNFCSVSMPTHEWFNKKGAYNDTRDLFHFFL